ncbi:putative sulfate transporter [Flavobacteriaceae bacterium UJ101]|nr:putative sulfate transporter [Flavobacteriaceae bacterium UJ101]
MAEFKLITKKVANAKDDILSGITVALALVPEAVAFAFVAGIDPLIGLYGAFMMGIVTSIFGGRPGMISGATGAMAVVMVNLVREGNTYGIEKGVGELGLQFLFVTLLFAGLIQIFAGVFKLGKFVRLIPHPVMMGFVNGLAIVIFLSQLGMFKKMATDPITGEATKQWLQGNDLFLMIGLVALTMFIMVGLPRITKKVPEALIAILIVSAIVIFGGLDVDTVGSFIKDGGGVPLSERGGFLDLLPSFQFDLFTNASLWNFKTLKIILPYAAILAAIGLIESLMTLNLIDDLTETRGNGNRECLAQGSANILNGLFGGMGGCAMIGQSIINIKSGGRGRLSGIVAALGLLFFILFGSQYIEQVPIAALVGVMFMVVIGTFAWSSFRILNKIPVTDALVIILVSAITVWQDLAVAVIAGVIISALVFSWENAKRIRARKSLKEDGTKVYEIWGPLFFGSITDFNTKFDVKGDPDTIEIDFIESKVADHSAIEAVRGIVNKYEAIGKSVKLKHLSEECKFLLNKANPKFAEIIIEDIDDPRYHVLEDPEAFSAS